MFFARCVNYPIEKWKTRATSIRGILPSSLSLLGQTSWELFRNNLDLKSRLFSLRLIMQILQTSGSVFRTSDDFLQLIKTQLCVSLSRNGVSSILELFEMALFNFLELIDKFKAHLKIQIEVSGTSKRNRFDHSLCRFCFAKFSWRFSKRRRVHFDTNGWSFRLWPNSVPVKQNDVFD